MEKWWKWYSRWLTLPLAKKPSMLINIFFFVSSCRCSIVSLVLSQRSFHGLQFERWGVWLLEIWQQGNTTNNNISSTTPFLVISPETNVFALVVRLNLCVCVYIYIYISDVSQQYHIRWWTLGFQTIVHVLCIYCLR